MWVVLGRSTWCDNLPNLCGKLAKYIFMAKWQPVGIIENTNQWGEKTWSNILCILCGNQISECFCKCFYQLSDITFDWFKQTTTRRKRCSCNNMAEHSRYHLQDIATICCRLFTCIQIKWKHWDGRMIWSKIHLHIHIYIDMLWIVFNTNPIQIASCCLLIWFPMNI